MANAKTLKFKQSLFLLGDGATPEVFSAPCGFESLEMSINFETGTTKNFDCDDPEIVAWLETDVISKQMVLTGQGTVSSETLPIWEAMWLNGTAKNARWMRDITALDGGGYYSGEIILTAYGESAALGKRLTFNVGIAFQGKPVWTAAT